MKFQYQFIAENFQCQHIKFREMLIFNFLRCIDPRSLLGALYGLFKVQLSSSFDPIIHDRFPEFPGQ